MRKITVGAMVSIDGVMQAPGGPNEDPTGGFAFGGWAMPWGDAVMGEEIDRMLGQADLLLGRRTYEIFAAYWPFYETDGADEGIASAINGTTKYIVSRSGEVATDWAGSVLLRSLDEVRRLREGDGPDLLTQGSTELVHALLADDLVDAMSIYTIPVVLGGGKRLFEGGAAPHAFELTRSRVSSTGIVIAHYARAGDVRIADPTPDTPSDRELARRERLRGGDEAGRGGASTPPR